MNIHAVVTDLARRSIDSELELPDRRRERFLTPDRSHAAGVQRPLSVEVRCGPIVRGDGAPATGGPLDDAIGMPSRPLRALGLDDLLRERAALGLGWLRVRTAPPCSGTSGADRRGVDPRF